MSENLEITGATAGSPRYVVAYYDVNTNNLYDSSGNWLRNNTLISSLGNDFIFELHYVKDTTNSKNPDNWVVWNGLDGQMVSSTLSFDNDYIHALEGKVIKDYVEGSTSIEVNVSHINKDTLSPSGILVVNPFSVSYTNPDSGMTIGKDLNINYSSFELVDTDTYKFTLEDVSGTEADIPAGTIVRVSAPMYMFIDSNSIYEANIQPRYEQGVFKFPMNLVSRKLLKTLDYTNLSAVSGTLEHNIYVRKNTLTGIIASDSFAVCVRDSSLDKFARSVSYYAWQNSSNGALAVLYTKSETPEQNEKVYKKLSNGTFVDANMVVSSVSDSSIEIKRADGIGTAVSYEKEQSANAYSSYIFCGWTDKADNPLVYYTKGNDIQVETPVYTIDSVTNIATIISGVTVDPYIDTDYVLFRTFSFPFIVRNLVNYGVSLNIPLDYTDWVKDYIRSAVKNSMEDIFVPASKGEYGIVKVGENIDVEDGVISAQASITVDFI